MTDDPVKQRRAAEDQVERWTAEAKKLSEAGDEAAALDLYRRAADELPGAPWLQQRTAELARKLKKPEVAVVYFRRAATAFQIADFTKRAVAPLRTAWSLAVEGLPGTSKLAVELAIELMQLHRKLGFTADATVTFERTNAALRMRGFSEMPATVLDSLRDSATKSAPPQGTATPQESTPPPSSSAAPRSASTAPGGAQSSRAQALSLGRRD